MICKNCKIKLIRKKNKYCSNKCKLDYEYNSYIDRWKAGEELGMNTGYELSNYIRRFIKEKYNNKCSVCGWAEINIFTGNIPLEIEHIDGNAYNNKENNLTLLCPNCHSLTSTYKGANKGNGRKGRKKYYINFNSKVNNEELELKTLQDNSIIKKQAKICHTCQKVMYNNLTYCSNKCRYIARAINIPNPDELLAQFDIHKSFVQVGKHYKVSNNAVKKWCIKYDILDIVKKARS